MVLNPFHSANNLYYNKAGSIPSSINLPDFTHAITSDQLYNLSITFSNDYTYKQAFFFKSDASTQLNWSLYTSHNKNFKAPAVPTEIRNLYPMLNTENLMLNFADYTHGLDVYSYTDYVNDNLSLKSRGLFEELRFVVRP